MRISDWSSDVCSSDLATGQRPRSDGLEGLRVLRVLDQATRSLQERGQPIESNEGRSIDGSFGRDISIHFSASVDGEAQVGEGTKIWHFSHVMSGARIGKGCVIGQNVMVGPGVIIGDRCKIQNNVSVYKGVTLEIGRANV